MALDADPPPGLKTQDITKTDIVAMVATVAAAASTFGFDMTGAQQAAIVAVLFTGYTVAQLLADAWRRHGRAKVLAAAAAAGSDPGMLIENLPAPTPAAPAAAAPTMTADMGRNPEEDGVV